MLVGKALSINVSTWQRLVFTLAFVATETLSFAAPAMVFFNREYQRVYVAMKRRKQAGTALFRLDCSCSYVLADGMTLDALCGFDR